MSSKNSNSYELHINLLAIVISFVLVILFDSLWMYIPLLLSLMALGLGTRYITADPPHKAIITRWGERQDEHKDEGLRYVIPIVEGLIPIDVTAKNQDLTPTETIRTPDLAPLIIPLSATWTPGSPNPKEQGKFLKNYQNKGGEKQIKIILADIAQTRVREWAFAEDEGPKKYQEALGAKDDATAILVKAIAGEGMSKIPSRIPTNILFKYYDYLENPMKKPNGTEKEAWGSNWSNVKLEIDSLTPEKKCELEKALDDRREIINQVKTGNGTQPIEQLGITLNRLNLKDINIDPESELAKAVEKQTKEEKETTAETEELRHVRDRIKELKDLGFSLQEARDIVQTERDKVVRKVNDIQGLEGFGQGIGEGISKIFKNRRE